MVAGDLDDRGAETAQRIRQPGRRRIGARADAAEVAGIESLITLAGREFGPVDIYVANAGIMGAIGLGDEDAWDPSSTSTCVPVRSRPPARTALEVHGLRLFRGGRLGGGSADADRRCRISGDQTRGRRFAEWLAVTYGDDGSASAAFAPMAVDTR